MSNVIPIVSSSPPPLDDDAGFGWEDDNDDDFGNFTSAPSIPTDTKGSNFEVNWSNCETSASQNNGSNESSSLKSGSNIESDEQESDSQSVDPHSLSPPPHVKNDTPNTGSKAHDNVTNIADFDSSNLRENISTPLNDSSQNKTDLEADPSVKSSEKDINSEIASPAGNNEFENFARFSNNSLSEKSPSSDTNGLPCEQTEKDCESAPTESDHSRERVHNSSPIQETDSTATDSETSVSVVVKNNESLYSNASTIDSGVFSADLSPSSQPSNLHCPSSDEKTLSLEANGDVSDIPSTDSLPTENPESDFVEDTAFHQNTVNAQVEDSSQMGSTFESNSSSQKYHKTAASCVDVDNEEWDDFNATVYSDSVASSSDQGHTVETADLEAAMTSSSLSVETVQHSSPEQDKSDADHSIELNVAQDRDPDDPVQINGGLEEKHEGSSEEIESDITAHQPHNNPENPKTYKIPEDLGSDAKANEDDDDDWGEFDSGVSETKDESDIERTSGNERDLCNERSANDDNGVKMAEPDVDCSPPGLISNCSNNLRETEKREITETDLRDESVVKREKDDSEEYENPTMQTDSHKCNALQRPDVDDNGESDTDEEFGNFSTFRDRKESDPQEVAPITFRKSICEADDDGDDVDEENFGFDRKMSSAFNEDSKDDDTHEQSDGEEDDFGDFDSAEKASGGVAKDNNDGDEFGDFGSSEPAGNEDSDWANFEATPAQTKGSEEFSSFAESPPKSLQSVESKQDKVHKVLQAVISSFPEQGEPARNGSQASEEQDNNHCLTALQKDESLSSLETVVELGLSNSLEAKQQTWTVVQHPSKKDPKVRLWGHLKDVDSSHALMYGWPTSYCSKEVFSTLHIDTLNVLFTQKKQAVPFFAAGLSILEPIRGSGGSQDGKKGKSNMPPPQPVLLDTSKPEVHQSPSTQDIPPVDFDWSSSGLTNPLTANTLDLDFLVVQGSDSCEKISDEWDWVFKADCQETAPSSLQPLEEILKKSTPTAKLATHEVLSPEALRILNKMPDLSFMQSRVLMFPVKQ